MCNWYSSLACQVFLIMSSVVARRHNDVQLITVIFGEYLLSVTWAAQMSRDIAADEASLCDKAAVLSSAMYSVKSLL